MLTKKFTILELVDLALRVPEVGAVNFNILHTVLTNLILETGLDSLKPICHIEDEVAAQAAVTKGRIEDPNIRGRQKRPTKHIHELKGMLKSADLQKISRESSKARAESKVTKVADLQKTDQESSKDKMESKITKATDLQKTGQETSEDKMESKIAIIDSSENLEKEPSRSLHQDEQQLDTEEESAEIPTDSKYEATEEDEVLEKDESSLVDDDTELPVQITSKSGSKLQIIVPEVSKSGPLEIIPIEEKAEQVREVAEDILKKTTDAPAAAKNILEGSPEEETAAVATQALKVLAEEEIFEADPSKVVQEMWRAININRRMDGAEEGLRELSYIVDIMLDKVQEMEEESRAAINRTKSMIDELDKYFERIVKCEENCSILHSRIDESNRQAKNEIERIEEMLEEMTQNQEITNSAIQDLSVDHKKLSEMVAYKEDLEEIKLHVSEMMDSRVKELKKRIREVQDMIIPKEDFMELISRIDNFDEVKVNREELGRLLETGFIDKLLSEQESLHNDVQEMKERILAFDEDLNALKRRIDDEIVMSIEESFANVNSAIETMKAKLDTLDADDINDSFARLEEQADMIIKEMEDLKTGVDRFEKEAKDNFKKISNVNALLDRLETTKADKSKMYELLELKADVEMVSNKLDRSEFVSVVRDIKGNLERLTIVVKINEEEMNDGFRKTRHELSLKMYTEDFITATEPIRHRIKAILYEQERVKEIALARLFPDAPGVLKCFSCKRGANLAGPKYQVNEGVPFQEKIEKEKPRKESVNLPPIDLDHLPIPPPDKPRIQDAALLPVLFANARPHVGMVHEKRRKDIDNELEVYFSSQKLRSIGGEYTKTRPQQKGLAFTTMKLPCGKRSEVLLKGVDKRFYKGIVSTDKDFISDEATSGSGFKTTLQNSSSPISSHTTISIPKIA